jgi:hypothetical protein
VPLDRVPGSFWTAEARAWRESECFGHSSPIIFASAAVTPSSTRAAPEQSARGGGDAFIGLMDSGRRRRFIQPHVIGIFSRGAATVSAATSVLIDAGSV